MRILLVEDYPGIRESLARYLRLRNHHVTAVATALEATDLLALPAANLDAVITDGNLPYLVGRPAEPVGIEVALVASTDPGLPVLLWSGDDVLVQRAKALGIPAALKGSRAFTEIEAFLDGIEARAEVYGAS